MGLNDEWDVLPRVPESFFEELVSEIDAITDAAESQGAKIVRFSDLVVSHTEAFAHITDVSRHAVLKSMSECIQSLNGPRKSGAWYLVLQEPAFTEHGMDYMVGSWESRIEGSERHARFTAIRGCMEEVQDLFPTLTEQQYQSILVFAQQQTPELLYSDALALQNLMNYLYFPGFNDVDFDLTRQ